MKNAGIAGGLVAIGIGLTTIGLSNFNNTPQAYAVMPTAVVEAGPEEPTIVWYQVAATTRNSSTESHYIYRGWSDGTIEVRVYGDNLYDYACPGQSAECVTSWRVISSPTEGMSAAADINFDEQVDGADLAFLLSRWGDAPRNPMPPSDCPLGLLNPS